MGNMLVHFNNLVSKWLSFQVAHKAEVAFELTNTARRPQACICSRSKLVLQCFLPVNPKILKVKQRIIIRSPCRKEVALQAMLAVLHISVVGVLITTLLSSATNRQFRSHRRPPLLPILTQSLNLSDISLTLQALQMQLSSEQQTHLGAIQCGIRMRWLNPLMTSHRS